MHICIRKGVNLISWWWLLKKIYSDANCFSRAQWQIYFAHYNKISTMLFKMHINLHIHLTWIYFWYITKLQKYSKDEMHMFLNSQDVHKQNKNINSQWCTFSKRTQNTLKIARNKILKNVYYSRCTYICISNLIPYK